MRLIRTAKTAAGRVDSGYVRRRHRKAAAVLLTVLALAASIAWWAVHQTRGAMRPSTALGRVAAVHAAMDSDCRMCHDQVGGHDKDAGHSARSQPQRRVPEARFRHRPASSFATRTKRRLTAPVNRPWFRRHPGRAIRLLVGRLRVVHIEHRGHEVLLGARNDSTCLQCHRDGIVTSRKAPPRIQPNVTQFAMHEHPQFGRLLTATQIASASPGPLHDPTPLNFSHAKHVILPDIKTKAGDRETCVVCHEPPSPVGVGIGVKPDQRYMQPVNFEKHCQSCHQLEVISGKGTPIPHVKLDRLRPLLDAYVDRNDYYLRQFAALSPTERKAATPPRRQTGPRPRRAIDGSRRTWTVPRRRSEHGCDRGSITALDSLQSPVKPESPPIPRDASA